METASIYTFEDRFIPLIVCPTTTITSWRKSDNKQYCPDYGDAHFLYGNFYTTRFSWLRLALHFCDDTPQGEEERRKAGRRHVKCAGRDRIMDYFASNIINLDVIT